MVHHAIVLAVLLAPAAAGDAAPPPASPPATAAAARPAQLPASAIGVYGIPDVDNHGKPSTEPVFEVARDRFSVWKTVQHITWNGGRRENRESRERLSYAIVRIEPLIANEQFASWKLHGKDDRGQLVAATLRVDQDGSGSLSYPGRNGHTVLRGAKPAPAPKKKK